MGNGYYGTFPYDDDFYEYGYGYGATNGFNILSGFILSILTIVILYEIIAWIFRSVGLYHMAKNRGINHAWFSWIPVLSFYIVGRLINNKVVLGEDIVTKHAEFFLPLLALLSAVISFSGPFGAAISVVIWVYEMSAYWRLFKIYRPKNRVSFTIWSAIIGSGFFIFAIRDDKPFDPLDPNKVYQNYYGNKKEIVNHYEEEIKEVTETEKETLHNLDNEYHNIINENNLDFEQRESVRKEYEETRRDFIEQVDSVRDELYKQEHEQIKELEQETIQNNNLESEPAIYESEIEEIIISEPLKVDEDIVLPEDLQATIVEKLPDDLE